MKNYLFMLLILISFSCCSEDIKEKMLKYEEGCVKINSCLFPDATIEECLFKAYAIENDLFSLKTISYSLGGLASVYTSEHLFCANSAKNCDEVIECLGAKASCNPNIIEVSAEGRCDDDTLIRCIPIDDEEGIEIHTDCSLAGLHCYERGIEGIKFAFCGEEECSITDFEPTCEGNVAKNCMFTATLEIDCSEFEYNCEVKENFDIELKAECVPPGEECDPEEYNSACIDEKTAKICDIEYERVAVLKCKYGTQCECEQEQCRCRWVFGDECENYGEAWCEGGDLTYCFAGVIRSVDCKDIGEFSGCAVVDNEEMRLARCVE